MRSVCLTCNIFVDILKALCLGAKAVGLGRPYLYAQSVCTVYIFTRECLINTHPQAYGAAGVVKITQILERELTLGMQLIGARTLKDLVPEMVRFRFPFLVAIADISVVRWRKSTGNPCPLNCETLQITIEYQLHILQYASTNYLLITFGHILQLSL